MTCVDTETVLAFLRRNLSAGAGARMEEHVDGCADCRALLAELARDAPEGSPDDVGPAAESPGPRAPVPPLPGYELGEIIGVGGMGIVYSARRQGTAEELAVKWIPGRHCGAHRRKRFTREARCARELSHPNVVRVIDFGASLDGGLFLAMERLEGEDLQAKVARGTLDAPEVVRIGCAAAAGLGAAHGAGILHRDVKPANLFLCRDGGIKVLDFGLALPLDPAVTRLTSNRAVIGTPAFLSVEQARASKREDPRTDVWGLGATLYFALAGRPPFAATTTTTQLARIIRDRPDPLGAEVPGWLGRIVLRALRKHRDARWQTMDELALALQEGLRAEPVPRAARRTPARGPDAAERALQRGEPGAVLEALARLPEEADRDETYRRRALEADALHALGRPAHEEAVLMHLCSLAQTLPERAAAQRQSARLERLRGRFDQALAIVDDALRESPDDPALQSERALTEAHAGRPALGLATGQGALTLASRGGKAASVAHALETVGHCQCLLGQVGPAKASFEEALVEARATEDRWPAIEDLRLALARVRVRLGRAAEVATALAQAAGRHRAMGRQRLEAHARQTLGLALAHRGDHEGALAAADAALVVARQVEDSSLTFACVGLRAVTLLRVSRPGDALGLVEQALTTPEDQLGHRAQELRALRAAALVRLGRLAEARTEAERALALRHEAPGMEEHEALLFLAAHEAGVPDALLVGRRILAERAEGIADPLLRRDFLARALDHARLMSLARQQPFS